MKCKDESQANQLEKEIIPITHKTTFYLGLEEHNTN